MINNPFFVNGCPSPECFCDREKETAEIISELENGKNVALVSPRGIGKSKLIFHIFEQAVIQENYNPIFRDLYPTLSLCDFISSLLFQILERLEQRGFEEVEKFVSATPCFRWEKRIDFNGNPFYCRKDIDNCENLSRAFNEIFRYLNSSEKPWLIALDEFQQINDYKDSADFVNFITSTIELYPSIRFIFSGCDFQLFDELFSPVHGTLDASAVLYELEPIPVQKYTDHCKYLFEKAGKTLEDQVVQTVCRLTNGDTLFMQRIMNELYRPEKEICTVEDLINQLDEDLDRTDGFYHTFFNMFPQKQKFLLLAIALEHRVKHITSAAFVRRCGLHSASSVSAAAKGLLKKGSITHHKGEYYLNDVFFNWWLRTRKFETYIDDFTGEECLRLSPQEKEALPSFDNLP